jgi:LysR family transcriptional regulator, transcriptional activator of nhaA
MRKLNHNQLYYFHVVAQEAGLAKGARRLGMAQSTLSEHLRTLERSLTTRLFHRSGNGLTLTDAGRAAFEHTEVMFEAAAKLVDVLCQDKSEVPIVPIGVASTVSRSLAAELFVPLFKSNDFRVRVRHGDHLLLQEQLMTGDLDLLLTDINGVALQNKGLRSETIRCPRMIAIAAPRLAATVKTFPNDLQNLPYIAYTLHSRYRGEIDEFFEDNNITPELLGEVDDVSIMLELTRAGHCFAVIPESVAHELLSHGSLSLLGYVNELRSNVEAVYAERSPSEQLRGVIELLSPVERA